MAANQAREHGNSRPIDHTTGIRGNHIIVGWPDTLNEGTRAAIAKTVDDDGGGRVVRQTAGTNPGWYITDGISWFMLASSTASGADSFIAQPDTPGAYVASKMVITNAAGTAVAFAGITVDASDNVSGIGTLGAGSTTVTTLSAGSTTVTSLNVSDGNITNVGDIALDTISADATNIGLTAGTFAVTGAVTISSTLTMSGTLAMGSNAFTSTGTLSAGAVTLSGALSVGDNNITNVNDIALDTISADDTNIGLTAGVFAVTGAQTISSTLTMSGNLLMGTNDITGIGALSGTLIDIESGSTLVADSTLNLVALGMSAGNFGTVTGLQNTAIGDEAGAGLTSGRLNTLVGDDAGKSLTEGDFNVIIGSDAGEAGTAIDDSIIIGVSAGASLTGSDVALIGRAAGRYITTGGQSAALGFQALQGITGAKTTGVGNVAMGFQAGLLVQGAATLNTLIGDKAGDIITTGSSNIIIGAGIDPASATTSSELNIGGLIGGDISTPTIGFMGKAATPAAVQDITGARDEPEGALADLLTSLALFGLITDSTTAS